MLAQILAEAQQPGVLFLFPLAFATIGTAVYLKGEAGGGSKGFALVVLVLSLFLQFGGKAHFIVPLGMQLVLCIWFVLYYQLDN